MSDRRVAYRVFFREVNRAQDITMVPEMDHKSYRIVREAAEEVRRLDGWTVARVERTGPDGFVHTDWKWPVPKHARARVVDTLDIALAEAGDDGLESWPA